MWDRIYPYLAAIIPTIVVSIFFYYLMKAILESDRRERLAQSKWDADHGITRARTRADEIEMSAAPQRESSDSVGEDTVPTDSASQVAPDSVEESPTKN